MKEQLTGRVSPAYSEIRMDNVPEITGEFRGVPGGGRRGGGVVAPPSSQEMQSMFATDREALKNWNTQRESPGFNPLENPETMLSSIINERNKIDQSFDVPLDAPWLKEMGINSMADMPADMRNALMRAMTIRGGAETAHLVEQNTKLGRVSTQSEMDDRLDVKRSALLDWHNAIYEKNVDGLMYMVDQGGDVREWLMRQIRVNKPEEEITDVERSTEAKRMRQYQEKLDGFVSDLRSFEENGLEKVKGDLLELVRRTMYEDVSDKRGKRDFYSPVIEGIAEARDGDMFGPIKSAKELGMEIMRYGDKSLWGEFGKYPILNPETGEVNQNNFIRWLREQIYFQHDLNPDDPIQVFRDIQIITGNRPVSIIEVFSNENYMRADEGEGTLTWLKNQIMKETWLFPAAHNMNAEYNKQKGSDEEIAKTIVQLYYPNTFSKRSFGDTTIRSVMTLPSMSEKYFKLNSRGEREFDSNNQELGKAIRRAFMTYYYISDPDMIEKIWSGEDVRNPFTHRNFISDISKLGNNPNIDRMSKEERMAFLKDLDRKKSADSEYDLEEGFRGRETNKLLFKSETERDDAFDANGKLIIRNQKEKEKFRDYMNIFNNPQKDSKVVEEVRARIRQALFEQGFDHQEAQYAEAWAYIFTNWTGAAARNDLSGIGFDAWQKGMWTRRYRERQARGERGGVHGNPYTIHGIHRLMGNFLEATGAYVGDQDDLVPLLHVIQGGAGGDVDMNHDIAPFHMPDNTMRQFAVNHVLRGMSLFHFVAETNFMNFDKFTEVDSFGRVTINYEEADKVLDNVFKAARYAYSTWDQIDFSAVIRDIDGQEKTIAEAFFGKQIIEDETGGKMTPAEIRDWQNNQNEKQRRDFWKRFVRYNIAAEIWAHRDFNSQYERYKFKHLHKIYDYLESIPDRYLGDESDFKTTALRDQRFFSKEDIEWIKKQTKTEDWRLLAEEGLLGLLFGLMAGTWDASKTVASNVAK